MGSERAVRAEAETAEPDTPRRADDEWVPQLHGEITGPFVWVPQVLEPATLIMCLDRSVWANAEEMSTWATVIFT